MDEKLMDVALGNQPADLIITGGRLVNVLTTGNYGWRRSSCVAGRNAKISP